VRSCGHRHRNNDRNGDGHWNWYGSGDSGRDWHGDELCSTLLHVADDRHAEHGGNTGTERRRNVNAGDGRVTSSAVCSWHRWSGRVDRASSH